MATWGNSTVKFILTILLFPIMLSAQDTTYAEQLSWTEQIPVKVSVPKFYHFSKNEIIGMPLMSLSAYYKATREAINYRGFGKGEMFWDINTSWKNKYKNWDKGDTRAKFPGSKTVLVMFTDGNHLMGAANTLTLTVGSYFVLSDFKSEWRMYKGWERVIWLVLISITYLLIISFLLLLMLATCSAKSFHIQYKVYLNKCLWLVLMLSFV